MISIPCARECAFLVLLLIFAMWIKTESERPKFRNDYRYEKAFGAFYKLHTGAVSWFKARIRCEAEGAELIVPETLDEADIMPLLMSTMLSKYDSVYIGLHDLYAERYFVTVQGSVVQDSLLDLLWELKEPRHSGGRCVAMRRNGHLFVNPCYESLPFVCKIKAEKLTYYKECNSFNPHWKLGPNKTCYITHEERQTWHDAFSTCLSAGGYLAVLNNTDEAEYLRELFKHVDQQKTPGDFAFLGFSDLFQRYHYRTVHGKPVDGANVDWDFQCPQYNVKKEMRCGGFRRSGLLATSACDLPSMFFCEKPAMRTFKLQTLLSVDSESKGSRNNRKLQRLNTTYFNAFYSKKKLMKYPYLRPKIF